MGSFSISSFAAMRDDHVVVLGYTGPDHSKIPFSADSDSKPSSQLPYLAMSLDL